MVQASPLAVPRYQVRKAGRELEWQSVMGFQQRDVGGVSAEKRSETEDEYLARLQGALAFYAAVLQSRMSGNPLGPSQAWQYLSRSAAPASSCLLLPLMRTCIAWLSTTGALSQLHTPTQAGAAER